MGEWIPEPLPERTEWIIGRPGDTAVDPADRVTLDESISMAFLVVLESMTPAERVAFVLHDVFRYAFAEVAEIVGRTPAACRQLASSARRRIRASQPPARSDSPPGRRRQRLQGGLGGQGHRRPDRPARPRRHGDRRRRRPRHHLPAPHRGRRADRARLGRDRQPGGRHHDVPGAHGQRPARSGGPAGRRHRRRCSRSRSWATGSSTSGSYATPRSSVPGPRADPRPSAPLRRGRLRGQDCSRGHHQVVRPPTWPVTMGTPSRGQRAPGLRYGMTERVCTPPAPTADATEASTAR